LLSKGGKGLAFLVSVEIDGSWLPDLKGGYYCVRLGKGPSRDDDWVVAVVGRVLI
jgi:hypothetical protein